MCTGCMTMFPKKDLIRIVKNEEGILSIDLKGKDRNYLNFNYGMYN